MHGKVTRILLTLALAFPIALAGEPPDAFRGTWLAPDGIEVRFLSESVEGLAPDGTVIRIARDSPDCADDNLIADPSLWVFEYGERPRTEVEADFAAALGGETATFTFPDPVPHHASYCQGGVADWYATADGDLVWARFYEGLVDFSLFRRKAIAK